MSVVLDHTIVWSRDSAAAARFLAELLELTVGPRTGLFLPVRLGNGITLDFADAGPDATAVEQHYAFGVTEQLFDRVLGRLRASGSSYWADPLHHRPGRTNTWNGGRGLYFQDLDGNNLEVQTVPDGAAR